MPATQAPYSQYFDKNGQPLDAGYVWFGLPNENPKTSPVNVYWDADLTQPALQPIRTLAGYLARNGSPAQVFTDGAYSQIVENKRFEMVYYAANSADYSDLPIRVAVITATDGQTLVNLPFAYTRGNNSLAIYLNGILLIKDRDYTETSTTSVTMIRPLKVGPGGADEVTAIGGRLINAASAIDAVSAAALAAGSGAGLVGYNPALTFPAGTVGERLQQTTWTVDAITAVNATALGLVGNETIVAFGRTSAGDDGGGTFRYTTSTSATVDDGIVFAPSVGTGRLIRENWTTVNVKYFGAIGDGSDATQAIQDAIDYASGIVGGAVVFVPSGLYLLSATLTVPVGGVSIQGASRDSVQFRRVTDYGPTILFGNSATLQNGYELSGIWFVDLAALAGSPGFMTVANSPAHVVFEHCARLLFQDCLISEGGGILLSGAANLQMHSVSQSYTVGTPTNRYGLRVRKSPIVGATNPLGGDLHCSGVNIVAGNVVDDGLLLEACDGFYWQQGCHILSTARSNVHLRKSGADQLTNIELVGGLLDITQGYSVWGDGSVGSGAIDSLRIECTINSASAGGTNGVYFDTTFGAVNVRLFGRLSGFSGNGFTNLSPFVSDMQIGCNLKALGGAAIYIYAGARFDVVSPQIGGDGSVTHGIRVGALANGVSISGGAISDIAGVGVQLDAGCENVSIVGTAIRGTGGLPLVDNSTTTQKSWGPLPGTLSLVVNVASAASIAVPVNSSMRLTGSTGVGAITGSAWEGRQITFVCPDAAITFTASSSIGNTITIAQNTPALMLFSGGKWHIA